MILVDIFAPILGKSYDFCLNEASTVGAVLEEVCEMICQKERWPAVVSPETMVLSCAQFETILPLEKSLWSCGVRTGYRLILT